MTKLIEKRSRWQNIKYDRMGNPFVTYYNMKFYLSDFTKGYKNRFVYCLTAFNCLFVEVDDQGGKARLTYAIQD